MKIWLLAMFCILLVAGEASAQKDNWWVFPTPGLNSGTWLIDGDSIRKLPNGNAVFTSAGPDVATQIEVNCVSREYRILKAVEIAKTDNYGNQTVSTTDITNEYGTKWTSPTPDSIRDGMNATVCRLIRKAEVNNSGMRKKATKKRTRRSN